MSNFASGYIKYINHLEQINHAAMEYPEKMIEEVEDSYREYLENTARNIAVHRDTVRLCMLSGPSSSGKTTTAHLLQKYLKDFGRTAYIVSLDDFYLGEGKFPLNVDGTNDFETVHALDVEKIQQCLMDIVEGKEVEIPDYSFVQQKAVGIKSVINCQKGEIVIVEGIHALNPIFTDKLPEGTLIKLYVSVKQQIKDVNGEVMAPFDMRLVRRIVRDMQFRNTSPEKTLAMWPLVLEGENKYIRPYRMSADYTVNSIHIYEPCVLRTIAIPILRKIPEDSPYYKKARKLEAKLMRFEPVDEALVPQKSMLREFIGRN